MAPRAFPFKKPAWASDTTGVESAKVFENTGLYEEILEQKRKERERREAKAFARAARKQDEERHAKRRRISNEVDDEQNSISDSSSLKSQPDQKRTPTPPSHRPITRSTPKKNGRSKTESYDFETKCRSPIKDGTGRAPPFQLVDDDNDDDEIQMIEDATTSQSNARTTESRPRRDEVEPESEDDDPYIQELKRKAREKAQSQNLERKSQTPTATFDHTSTEEISTFSPPPEKQDEPMVKLMINTMIPNARPLIVNRKVSQDFGFVREYFCKHMLLSPFVAEKVFLTWRGNKLFDSTTARSLLQTLKKEARIPETSDEDPSHGKLEIEATTQEIFDYKEKQSQERLKEEERIANGGSGGKNDDGVQEAEKEKVHKIAIRLKCPTHEMTLKVRPTNTIETVMKAFQKTQEIDESKTCWLVFDGERLDREATVESVELEDGDEVEVHIH